LADYRANQRYNSKGNWNVVNEYLKDKFTGKFIIYNLLTAPKKNIKYINLYTKISSANNCIEFLGLYTHFKLINLYGIGIYSKDYNYHKNFKGNGNYSLARINQMKKNIFEISKKYNLTINFN